jgi:SAM-dependent methyltransferase
VKQVGDGKAAVQDFWERASCGEELYLSGVGRAQYEEQERARYALEPYIEHFADFENASGKRVLEVGVGLGADHQRFAESGAVLSGIDLTTRAIEHTKRRLRLSGLDSDLSVGDAEQLKYPDGEFDVVYSWGVIHHSPDTTGAIREIFRVLRPGGTAKVMIYHKWSLVGLALWVRYSLLRLRPWQSLAYVYANYLESPGTKAYTVGEAARMFAMFSDVDVRVVLTHGDLLESGAGQRHRGLLLTVARKLWPRRLLRMLAPKAGLFMLITAVKGHENSIAHQRLVSDSLLGPP